MMDEGCEFVHCYELDALLHLFERKIESAPSERTVKSESRAHESPSFTP